MKVRFGYSDSEDRMWMRVGPDGPLWWFTRRMALRLVSQWAALMERTFSAAEAGEAAGGAGSAPGARSLSGEHGAALAPRPAPPPEEGGDGREETAESAPASASALVFGVDLGARGDQIRVVLRSASKRQAILLARDDSHRLLASMVSRCRRNGWLEAALPAWLELGNRPAS